MQRWFLILIITGFTGMIFQLAAAEYYVDDVPTNGSGTLSDPFNNFDDALNAAQPGDIVYVLPGTYSQAISTVRDGTANQRITLMAYDPDNRPLATVSGRVVEISDAFFTLDGFIIDGQFGSSDVVRISSGGDNTIIRNCEIKNGIKDGIDMNEADDVLIEDCEIHHMLGGTYNNQVDAHGIVATGETNLTIRGCNIYYVSGDCFQTDPNRGYPLWDNVLIEDCQLWTGPLPDDAAGWNAGEVPGENAVDTKINEDAVSTSYRANITIRNVVSHGFVSGYINNCAAFNIKEKVECKLINIKVYNNEIAFRLRGPGSRGGAHVTIINAIAYDNDKTFRTEDEIEFLHIYNGTFDDGGDGVYFQNTGGGYDPSGFEMMNCLFVGTKPDDAAHASNLSAGSSYFMNLSTNDYHLSANSPAIDAGVDIAEVTEDYEGNPRYSGSYDAGAFEYTGPAGLDDDRLTTEQFYLYSNFPNPFNPETQIAFELPQATTIELAIFDLSGRKIRTLVGKHLPAGYHLFRWNGRSDDGNPAASGIYFYRLETPQFSQTKRMILLR